MGATESNQTSKDSYDRLKFVRTLAPSKTLVLDPATKEHFITVENTFPS